MALETAPASQSARTVTSFISAGLRGAVLGNSMVAFVTGDLPLTYTAPVAGTHTLLGLKPNTTYRVPGVVSQSTQAGVLSFRVPAIGSLCTISESSSPPPPPPPVPVISSVQDASHTPITHAFDGTPAFITGTGFGVVSGSVTVAGLPASVTAWTSTQIGVTLPKLPAQFALEQAGPVVVTTPSGVGTSAFAFKGRNLDVTFAPLRDHEDAFAGYIVSLVDRTEERRGRPEGSAAPPPDGGNGKS